MSWIFSIVRVLHILCCFFLILVVLLQAGKGAGIGSAFGGAGSAVFGGRGAGGFISKVTWVVAGIFMMTSVSLAWRSTQRGSELLKKKSKPVSAEKLLMEEAPTGTKDATDTKAPDSASDIGAPLEGTAAEDATAVQGKEPLKEEAGETEEDDGPPQEEESPIGDTQDKGEPDTKTDRLRDEAAEREPSPAVSRPRPADEQTTRPATPRPRDVRQPPRRTNKQSGAETTKPEGEPRARPRRVVPSTASEAPARPARPSSTSSDGE